MASKVLIICALAVLAQVYADHVDGLISAPNTDSLETGLNDAANQLSALFKSIAGQNCGCSSTSGSSRSYGSSSSSGISSVVISNSGGDLLVTSVGPISPSGIAVSSDLGLSGDLDVKGELPFLSAVEFSGKYDTKGSGCVDYSCGCSNSVGITSVQGSSGCGCGK